MTLLRIAGSTLKERQGSPCVRVEAVQGACKFFSRAWNFPEIPLFVSCRRPAEAEEPLAVQLANVKETERGKTGGT
jgi:hypothetical protein